MKDKLILFSDPTSIKEIEKFSEVNIEFFDGNVLRKWFLQRRNNAKISVEDRGFNFSDGVYELISYLDEKLIFLKNIILD